MVKMSFSLIFLAIILSLVKGNPSHGLKHDKPTPIMIASMGYPSQTHTITTEDCYILEMHRIPHGKGMTKATKPPILLVHGLLGSSADWVMGIPEKYLGYILADAGYDVWLGNARGNTYSRSHCTMDPSDLKFWDFSFDQIGEFDLPAMIDKVIDATGAEKIHYGGHSMGTTSFMVMANKKPEYQEKIILANLLAPIAFVDHMISPLKYIAPFAGSIDWILEFLGVGEFLPSNAFTNWIAGFFCDEGIFQGICENVVFILCGFDEAQTNNTLFETIVHHTPAGASTNTLLHYAQEINSKRFCAFDYKDRNQEIYGQDTPPDYDLGKVTAPVALYWGDNDWLAQQTDILRLITKLPNIVNGFGYEVPYEKWNHLDFIYGIDANIYVYEEMLKVMQEHEALAYL